MPLPMKDTFLKFYTTCSLSLWLDLGHKATHVFHL